MHGRTFTALKIENAPIATIWDRSEHRGRCGTIVEKIGTGRKTEGDVVVRFEDGTTYRCAYDLVALGNNGTRR
jgi:hypothetical protein